jgi:hypothetical protein
MAVAVLTAAAFAFGVYWKRQVRVVKTLQPLFLITLCVGIGVMATSIIPFSIDDGLASQRGCDIACMATPWLLTMGFTIAMSALISKLWRINLLFHVHAFRRVEVRERDVIAPFVILFSLNSVLMLVWTLVDPLTWVRSSVNGQSWNTFGACRSGTGGIVAAALVGALNGTALVLATIQAYKAREISTEFSESRNLGIALFSWVQMLVVGLPVLFLIEDDNRNAKYFLEIALIFAGCMSMMLIIFIPIILQVRNSYADTAARRIEAARHNLKISTELKEQERRGPEFTGKGGTTVGRGSIRVSGLSASHAPVTSSDGENASVAGGSMSCELKPSSALNLLLPTPIEHEVEDREHTGRSADLSDHRHTVEGCEDSLYEDFASEGTENEDGPSRLEEGASEA